MAQGLSNEKCLVGKEWDFTTNYRFFALISSFICLAFLWKRDVSTWEILLREKWEERALKKLVASLSCLEAIVGDGGDKRWHLCLTHDSQRRHWAQKIFLKLIFQTKHWENFSNYVSLFIVSQSILSLWMYLFCYYINEWNTFLMFVFLGEVMHSLAIPTGILQATNICTASIPCKAFRL